MSSQPPGGTAVAWDKTAIDWSAELARHHRWLRTIVYARLGEPQAVEDVMQEVSLAAVKQSAPLADSAKIGPWLYRLAVRAALLHRRKAGRQRRLVSAFAMRTQPREEDTRTGDPLDWLLADERQRQVRQALAELARRDREILLLKYTENWSYRQMAEHLGISEAAIETRLHRARGRLRERLSSLADAVPQASGLQTSEVRA